MNSSRLLENHILPDGSSLWLEPQAIISYRNPFGTKNREITLKGKSFFEIKHDINHPFIIHTKDFDTRVLGTSFTINSSEKGSAKLSVISGKVFVYVPLRNGKASKGVIVLPKQKVIYTPTQNQLEKSKETDPELRIWDKKSFVFDNVPVTEVLSALKANFGVQIKVNPTEIDHLTLNADFTGLNLPVILKLMNKSLNVNFGFCDETIIIENRN